MSDSSDSKTGDLARFFKHSSIYAVGNVINRIGAFLLLPIYTNYLTVAEYGTLELFYSTAILVGGLVSTGFAHATLRFYFEYDELRERNQVVITNLAASMLITVLGVSVIALFAEPISLYLFHEDLSLALYIVLATVVLETSSQVCLAYVRAVEKSVLFIVLSSLKLVVQVSVNATLVIAYQAGVTGVLFGNLLAVLTGWLILIVFVVRNCGLGWDFAKLKQVLLYSYPFVLSSITGLVRGNADKFLINGMLGVEALGLYALAMQFAQVLDSLLGAPFRNSYGAFRYSVMKQENAGQMQADIFRLLMIGSFTLALGLAFYAIDVLRIMSAREFHGASILLPLLLLGSLTTMGRYVSQSGILISKNTKYIFYISLMSAVLSVVFCVVLIDRLGVQGACLAQFLTGAATLVVTEMVSRRYFRVAYDYKKLALLFALGCASYLGYLAIMAFGSFEFVLKSLVGLGFLWLVVRLRVLEKKELDQGLDFVKRKIGYA